MGSVWGLAVHLLFFCWKAGVTASSAVTGLSISSPAPLVTTDNIQVPAFTQCVPPDTQSLKAETASKTLIATSTSSEVNSRDTQTISPIPETRNTTSPTASSLETQTTSPTLSSLGTQTTSPTASSLGTQTTSPTASSMGIQTTSPEASTLGSQTTFPTTEALKNQTIFPVELTLKTQTISSVTETRTLAIRIPSNFTVVHPIPTDTSDTLATSGSPRTGMSIVKSGTVSDPIEAIFDTLCTDDSSEEARKITIDLLTLAYTSTEAESLSSESSSSSDSSGGVLTSSRVLEPDIATPAKDSIAFSITHIKLTTCITEIETSVISGTPDTNHSPTGATASSTSEMLTWPQCPEAKLLSPKTTSSPGTLSASSTSVLATTLEGTLPIHVTVRETTVAQIPTSGGTLVTVSMNPLKETSALSTETQGHTEVLGTITVPRSTMGKATSFSGSSTSDSSPSAGTTTKNSITSETLTADDMTSSSFLTGSRILPFVSSTTASTSKKPNVPSAKTTASPKTAVKPPTPTPTAAWTRRTTKHGPGEDGGFLLVRLSVASPQDLTEPKATEKLMHQLSCELHTHMPLVQVSLLSIRRG